MQNRQFWHFATDYALYGISFISSDKKLGSSSQVWHRSICGERWNKERTENPFLQWHYIGIAHATLSTPNCKGTPSTLQGCASNVHIQSINMLASLYKLKELDTGMKWY